MKKLIGFFPLYWDEKGGNLFLEIKTVGEEFFFCTSLATGLESNDIDLDCGRDPANSLTMSTLPVPPSIWPGLKFSRQYRSGNLAHLGRSGAGPGYSFVRLPNTGLPGYAAPLGRSYPETLDSAEPVSDVSVGHFPKPPAFGDFCCLSPPVALAWKFHIMQFDCPQLGWFKPSPLGDGFS